MAPETEVSTDDVRTELNNVAPAVVSDDVIQQQLDHAHVIVGAYAADDADAAAIEMAVTVVAAYGTLTSDSGGWTTVAEEMDAREEYDVENMVAALEARRAEALAIVSPDGTGPTLRGVGDRYPSA